MSEAEKDKLPDPSELVDVISKSEPWNPVYRRQLEELFKLSYFRSAVRELLVQSDNQLKLVGMSDLSNKETIDKCLKIQGAAQGLAQAVEILADLASTEPETTEKEN